MYAYEMIMIIKFYIFEFNEWILRCMDKEHNDTM